MNDLERELEKELGWRVEPSEMGPKWPFHVTDKEGYQYCSDGDNLKVRFWLSLLAARQERDTLKESMQSFVEHHEAETKGLESRLAKAQRKAEAFDNLDEVLREREGTIYFNKLLASGKGAYSVMGWTASNLFEAIEKASKP